MPKYWSRQVRVWELHVYIGYLIWTKSKISFRCKFCLTYLTNSSLKFSSSCQSPFPTLAQPFCLSRELYRLCTVGYLKSKCLMGYGLYGPMALMGHVQFSFWLLNRKTICLIFFIVTFYFILFVFAMYYSKKILKTTALKKRPGK